MSTETLKNLLNGAADDVIGHFVAPDVDRMMRDGERQRRRRGALVAVGGLAAAAVVAASIVAVTGGSGSERSIDAAGSTAPLDQITWTLDGELHTTSATYDLGHDVAAYVRTAAGFAFADPDGVVYSFVGGEVTQIGRTSVKGMRLVADVAGSRVGWVQPGAAEDETPTFVVRDLAGGDEQAFGAGASGMGALADEEDPFYFYGIDGDTAYVRDSRGSVAVDLAGGQDRVLDARADNGFDIGGVGAGLVATADDGDDGQGSRVGAPGTPGTLMVGGWGTAYISPDGRWVSFDADDASVFDVATGKRITLDAQSEWFSNAYEWLDEDTVAVVAAAAEDADVRLLTCEAPSGECTVAVPDIGTFEEIESSDFNVPLGIPID